ncbi:rhodanese-like domain-containing protein [Clostridium sp.]
MIARGSKVTINIEIGAYKVLKTGATEKSTIAFYAEDERCNADKLYWQIKLLGHEDVRVLDGGTNPWAVENYLTGNARKLVDEEMNTDCTEASYEAC